jgi:hypothetical protein
MIEVSACVICDGPIRKLKPALIAPFIAWRIWNRDPFCIHLVQCQSCGFVFYNPRPDDAELAREYIGYRSPEYLQMRRSFEPWYTARFNADLASPAHYQSRRAKLAPIFQQHLRHRAIHRVLDHGGDHGDLMLGLFGDAQLFLYDISGAAPAPGVTAVSDPASCRPDLILNSNVIEHVGFPRTLVRHIFDAAPPGSLVFLETPCENALGLRRILRRLAQIPFMIAATPRLARHILQTATLYMMHEHINYYTEQSITTLVQNCGGRVIASGFYPLSSRASSEGVVWCLGEKEATK